LASFSLVAASCVFLSSTDFLRLSTFLADGFSCACIGNLGIIIIIGSSNCFSAEELDDTPSGFFL